MSSARPTRAELASAIAEAIAHLSNKEVLAETANQSALEALHATALWQWDDEEEDDLYGFEHFALEAISNENYMLTRAVPINGVKHRIVIGNITRNELILLLAESLKFQNSGMLAEALTQLVYAEYADAIRASRSGFLNAIATQGKTLKLDPKGKKKVEKQIAKLFKESKK